MRKPSNLMVLDSLRQAPKEMARSRRRKSRKKNWKGMAEKGLLTKGEPWDDDNKKKQSAISE